MEGQIFHTEIGEIHLLWETSLQARGSAETMHGRLLEIFLELLLEEAQEPTDV